MSDQKDTKKDGPEAPPLKDFTHEYLTEQLRVGKEAVDDLRARIAQLEANLQRQIGINGYAEHVLKTFRIPNAASPKENKTPSEVI